MAARSSKSLADPTALAKFGGLEVVAKLLVEGYMIGQHKSPFKGSSVEFVGHPQYHSAALSMSMRQLRLTRLLPR